MTGPAVLLAPDDDRLGWLVAATRYAQRAGLSVDAVTADVDTAAQRVVDLLGQHIACLAAAPRRLTVVAARLRQSCRSLISLPFNL